MQVLHNAYEYVMRQVALNTNITYEDLEADFLNFCAAQTVKPPTFYDIHTDVFNLAKFHSAFEANTEVDKAFLEGGYSVVPSEVTTEYDPQEKHDITPFTTEITVYTEPHPRVMPQEMVRDFEQDKITDYSCSFGGLWASDYKAGLSPPTCLPDETAKHDVMKAFETMVQSRTRVAC